MFGSTTAQLPLAADVMKPNDTLEPLPTGWTSLPRAFTRTARQTWSKVAMVDSLKVSLTYGEALTRAIALGRVLGRELGPGAYVGVMVPPSVAGVVANLALLLLGKIPINLNYSASQEVIDKAVDRCQIQQVITSQKFLDRVKLTPKGALIYLEDLPAKVGTLDKVWAASVARVVPEAMLGSFLGGLKDDRIDKTATVMFTSGSTGDPKGVVLTHGNILSNVHQMRQHLQLDRIDVVGLGVLPFFHSFGFTVGIWTILLLGKKAVYHSNPLDAKVVADLCEKHAVTLIAVSPTFFPPLHPAWQAGTVPAPLPRPARRREAETRGRRTHRGNDPHRPAGRVRDHRDVAGSGGERPVLLRVGRRPHDRR